MAKRRSVRTSQIAVEPHFKQAVMEVHDVPITVQGSTAANLLDLWRDRRAIFPQQRVFSEST